ncbi:hypothetical protein H0H92_003000 [Tricholoma furcatifolium]|nr:hypothetical protein H0H92_003000 [Tricholoma furcatifolium]
MSTDNSSNRYNFRSRALAGNLAGVFNGGGVGGHGEPGTMSSSANDGSILHRRARTIASRHEEPARSPPTLVQSRKESTLVQHEETTPSNEREYHDVTDTLFTESREISEFTNLDRSMETGGATSNPLVEGNLHEVDTNELNILSLEQIETVSRARAQMDPEQRHLIDKQMQSTAQAQSNKEIVNGHNNSTDTDEEIHAGPSVDKGKNVDPRNWGHLDFLNEEMDPDVQRQILQACNDIMNKNKSGNVHIDEPQELNDPEAVKESENEELTREDLKEKLKLQSRIIKELKACNKRINKGPKKFRTHRAASEPLSQELEGMIGKLTNVNKKISLHREKNKSEKTNLLNPVNQITKDSTLGRAFKHMRNNDESSGSSPSDSSDSSLSSSESSSDDDDGGYSSDDELNSSDSGSSESSLDEGRRSGRRRR